MTGLKRDPLLGPSLDNGHRFDHYHDALWILFVGAIFLWGLVKAWRGLEQIDLGQFYCGLVGIAAAVIMAVVE